MIMDRGKDICKELKAVRRQIAEENDIPLEIPECTYQGPCKGTCPRCESEVRFLENALAKRIKLGKVAKVAGLALTLAVSNGAKAQSVTPTPDPSQEGSAGAAGTQRVVSEDATRKPFNAKLIGVIKDSKTKESLPFVNVAIKQDGKQVTCGVTDFDGIFTISVPSGVLDLEIATVGYYKYVQTGITIPEGKKRIEMEDILLEPSATTLGEVIIEGGSTPIIEIGPEGGTNTEIQGVPLRIQY